MPIPRGACLPAWAELRQPPQLDGLEEEAWRAMRSEARARTREPQGTDEDCGRHPAGAGCHASRVSQQWLPGHGDQGFCCRPIPCAGRSSTHQTPLAAPSCDNQKGSRATPGWDSVSEACWQKWHVLFPLKRLAVGGCKMEGPYGGEGPCRELLSSADETAAPSGAAAGTAPQGVQIYLRTLSGLCWVFTTAWAFLHLRKRPTLVWHAGFSLWWLLLWRMGSGACGLQ